MMEDVEYKLISNEQEFNEMLEELNKETIISFDTENNGLNQVTAVPAGFSVAVNEKVGYYVPINHTDIKTDLHKRFDEVVKNKELIVMHNSPYDAGIVEAQYNFPEIRKFDWFDTMVAAHLYDEERGKCGLKYCSKVYLHYKQSTFSDVMGDSKDPTSVPATSIYKYAIDDAICTLRLYKFFKEKLKEQNMETLFYDIEMPFQKVLLEMKLNGFCFDSKLNLEIENKLRKDQKEVVEKLLELLPHLSNQQDVFGNKVCTFNFGSAQELAKLLYQDLKLPILKRTPGGVPCTDSKTLPDLKDEEGEWLHPVIPLLLKYKEIAILISTFTSSLRKEEVDGKIHGDLLDIGTETGRLSAHSPNLQQLAKGEEYPIRHCFKASPGYKMVAIDFSQEELRLAGVVAKSEQFREAFNNKEDMHLKVANACFNLGIPSEAISEDHPDHNHYKNKYKKERFRAKFINFGTVYGIGALGISRQAKCTEQEGKEMLNNYFNQFPEIKRAMNASHMLVDKKGYITNFYGRKRRFKRQNDGTYNHSCYRQAFNFCISGDSIVCDKQKGIVPINILEGTRLLWDGNNWSRGKVIKSGKKKLVNIYLSNGDIIKCSEDHPFLTVNTYGSEIWKTSKEFCKQQYLRLGDSVEGLKNEPKLPEYKPKKVALQKWQEKKVTHNYKHKSFNEIKDYYKLGLVLGRLASDGCYVKKGECIWIVAEHEKEYVLPVLLDILKDFDPRVKERIKPNRKPIYYITIHGKSLTYQLEYLDIKNKVHNYFTLNKDLMRGYLKGFFDGDGTASCENVSLCFGKRHNKTSLPSDIHKCLYTLGIRSIIGYYKESVRLRIRNADYTNFKNEVGFINEKKNKLVPYRNYDKQLGRNLKIKKVELTEEEIEMYDFINSSTQRFMVNGVVTHNCVQGLASDILRVVMNALYDYSMTTNKEVKIISTVHDEVIFEVKDNERLQQHIDRLVDIMENTVQTRIPLKVDYDIGSNYGEAK